MQSKNIVQIEIKTIEFEKFLLITNASLEFSFSFFAHLGRSRMMQNRARSSRRNKVTVRWLPVELIIEIFRRVQKLIGRYDFKLNWKQSMKLDQEYCNNLLAFALMRQEWTAIAQAELFRNIILNDQSKTGQFLKLVRGNMELRRYADSATSIRFGHLTVGDYDAEGLDDDLNEIALYCPNVVEISCFRVDVKLDYFSMSISFSGFR
jgi:hypothetical protein